MGASMNDRFGNQPARCRSSNCEPPWCKSCGGQPLDRYHRFPWQEGPKEGELEYLRYIQLDRYFVTTALPWDGRGALHNKKPVE